MVDLNVNAPPTCVLHPTHLSGTSSGVFGTRALDEMFSLFSVRSVAEVLALEFHPTALAYVMVYSTRVIL